MSGLFRENGTLKKIKTKRSASSNNLYKRQGLRPLHHQVNFLSMTIMTKILNYSKRLLPGALLLIFIPAQCFAIVVGAGYTKLGTWNPQVVTTSEGSTFRGTNAGNSGGIYAIDYPNFLQLNVYANTVQSISQNCNANPGLAWVTLDGWTGYQLGPGVIMVFSGSATGTQKWEAVAPNAGQKSSSVGNASWDSKGTPSGKWKTRVASNCAGITPPNYSSTLAKGTSTGATLTYGVYVTATAKPATYSDHSIVYGLSKGAYLASGGNVIQEYVRLTLPLIQIKQASCTLSTQTQIDFGDVTPGQSSGGKGIAVPSTLSVNCENYSGAAIPVNYSIKPITQAGDKYTIPLVSTAGGIAGDVRGFIGASAANDAGCTDKTTSMRLDNTPVLLRNVPNSPTTSWSDPLSWVLCPRIDAKPGPAKATATIEVNW